ANQFAPLPYFLAKCNRTRFRQAVAELATGRRFDLPFCDFLPTAAPLVKLGISPRVGFEHNVEFPPRKTQRVVQRRPLRKVVFDAEWKKTRRIEAEVCRSFDHVFAVSKEDQHALRQEFNISSVSVLNTGVDPDFFRPMVEAPQPCHLVFVGSMDWDPNEDGLIWFLRDIYPIVKRHAPQVTLSIVGRSPSARLRAVAAWEPGVDITGRVGDVRPYLARAEVVIVPLRAGSGTRIKIPEAMAMQKAVVSTPVGAEGLALQDGREICIAENPERFAKAVVDLVKSGSLRESIAET